MKKIVNIIKSDFKEFNQTNTLFEKCCVLTIVLCIVFMLVGIGVIVCGCFTGVSGEGDNLSEVTTIMNTYNTLRMLNF